MNKKLLYKGTEKTKYYKECIEPNEEIVEAFADDIGLYTDKPVSYYMWMSEAFSRKAGEEAIWTINPDVKLVQKKSLTSRYDILIYSGGTAIKNDIKFRNLYIDDYPTTDISAAKGDFISNAEGWITIVFKDNNFLVFDLTKYTPKKSKWRHSKTTAINGKLIEEDRYCFEPEKALFSGKLDKEWLLNGGYGRHS